MRLVKLEQGSQEWLDWRKKVITATDCPAILDKSPWATPYKLWARKLGLIEDIAENAAMSKGKKLEPVARQKCIREIGIELSPAVVESTEFPYLGASLDGLSDNWQTVVEIKCGGIDLHDMAMQGIIPEHYQLQIQHQLFVTGASQAIYYSYYEGSGIAVPVLPWNDFAEKFLPKAKEFLEWLRTYEAPPLTPKDYVDRTNDPSIENLLSMYQTYDQMEKQAATRKAEFREKIIEATGGQSTVCKAGKVIQKVTRGRVDYNKIPALQGLDLEPYRGETKASWCILLDKGEKNGGD